MGIRCFVLAFEATSGVVVVPSLQQAAFAFKLFSVRLVTETENTC